MECACGTLTCSTTERTRCPLLFSGKFLFRNIIDTFEPPRTVHTAAAAYHFQTRSVTEGEEGEEEVGEELFFFPPRFRSRIVNHINLLSYRPQWRLRWFMWFQLYGFVNLQPYIIHEFIFHVFRSPLHTQGLQCRLVNEDYWQIFGFLWLFAPWV